MPRHPCRECGRRSLASWLWRNRPGRSPLLPGSDTSLGRALEALRRSRRPPQECRRSSLSSSFSSSAFPPSTILIHHRRWQARMPRGKTAAKPSMRGRRRARQMRASRHPLVVGLKRHPRPVVGNAHIAVRAARYRFRHHGPHLLRHHPDIGGVAAVVDEAIIAETIVKPPEEHDIVLEAHVGATPAAAPPHPPPPPPPPPEAAPAAPAEAAAAAPAAEAALHSPAAERAAIGESRV